MVITHRDGEGCNLQPVEAGTATIGSEPGAAREPQGQRSELHPELRALMMDTDFQRDGFNSSPAAAAGAVRT